MDKVRVASLICCNFNRPIPFEDVLTILVSTFHLLRDERKGRESACVLREGRKGGGKLLIQTESVCSTGQNN